MIRNREGYRAPEFETIEEAIRELYRRHAKPSVASR